MQSTGHGKEAGGEGVTSPEQQDLKERMLDCWGTADHQTLNFL